MRSVGEYLHSEFREPSLGAAAVFKRLAKESKEREDADKKPDIKPIQLCCMSCGVQNGFKEVNEETIEVCKNCGKPIFRKEENKK